MNDLLKYISIKLIIILRAKYLGWNVEFVDSTKIILTKNKCDFNNLDINTPKLIHSLINIPAIKII
jgi:hypothetical protein